MAHLTAETLKKVLFLDFHLESTPEKRTVRYPRNIKATVSSDFLPNFNLIKIYIFDHH